MLDQLKLHVWSAERNQENAVDDTKCYDEVCVCVAIYEEKDKVAHP